MRFAVVAAIAALSSTVVAQNLLDQIPKCAQTCFGNSLGTCGPVDIQCICGNKSVINAVSCCVFATCSKDDITKTTTFAVGLCKTAGIDVDTNPTCPSNSVSISSSIAASASSSATASASQTSASHTSTSAAVATGAQSRAAAAPLQTGVGLGMAIAGLVALL